MKKLLTKEDVYELLNSSLASAALGTAIESGLLRILAEKPMDGGSVAQALNIPGKRCNYWLQYLCSVGILEAEPQGYVPSPLARAVLLDANNQESWKHLAIDDRELAGVHNLALFIREVGSVWKAQGLTAPKGYVEKMNGSLERAREFTRMLYEVHQRLGNELAALLDLTDVHSLMDVGGGSGVVSMALLRKYPDLKVTIVDVENVCIAGREIVEENLLSDRITYHAADFVVDDLPHGFDVILHCDVGVFGEDLFHKLWKSLKYEGRIIVVFNFPASENLAPEPFLEWAFLASLEDPDFGFSTVAQVQVQLVRTGFRLLPGEYTLPDGRIVLQAQKIQG